MRSFNLLRYFTVASLVVIALLALATAWVFSRNLENSLTEEAGLYAEDMAASLNRAIFRDFLEPLASAGREVDLEDPAQRGSLARIIESHTRGLRILTVNIFDASGTIVREPKTDKRRRATSRGAVAAAPAPPSGQTKKDATPASTAPSRSRCSCPTPVPTPAAAPASSARRRPSPR